MSLLRDSREGRIFKNSQETLQKKYGQALSLIGWGADEGKQGKEKRVVGVMPWSWEDGSVAVWKEGRVVS